MYENFCIVFYFVLRHILIDSYCITKWTSVSLYTWNPISKYRGLFSIPLFSHREKKYAITKNIVLILIW